MKFNDITRQTENDLRATPRKYSGSVAQAAVSVVGLGKLGACMAAAMASRGVRTIGVDVNPHPVDKVRQKLSPVFEPGLAEMIASCDGLLHATMDFAEAVRQTDTTFVIVPTPSKDDGTFSLQYVCAAMESIGHALRGKQGYHLVALTSTVLPGSTDFVVKPLLERTSGKRCGPDFGLCYSPEFIALGSVIQDFLNPDVLLIGESDTAAGDRLASFYRDSLRIGAPAARMSPINAELAKIALNTFVTTKITFANLLAELCERLPGGDVDAVTHTLGLDRRIGAKYLRGALGYGGPCFPRDNQALARFLEEMGVCGDLPRTVDRQNRSHPGRVVTLLQRLVPRKAARVAVLGLAYKPDTNVVEESQGLAIAKELAEKGYEVVVFDPAAMEGARKLLGESVIYAATLLECIHDAGAIVVATDWPEFRSLIYQTANCRPRPVIIDGWRMLRPSASGQDGMSYRAIGIGQPDREMLERLRSFVERLAQPKPAADEAGERRRAEAAAG
jgi:UDPglucose 6-dehydrogenase